MKLRVVTNGENIALPGMSEAIDRMAKAAKAANAKAVMVAYTEGDAIVVLTAPNDAVVRCGFANLIGEYFATDGEP